VCVIFFALLFTINVGAENTYKEQYDASGAEEIYDMLPNSAKDILDGLDIEISDPDWVNQLDYENIFQQIWGFIKDGAKTPLACGTGMLAVIILIAAANTFQGFGPYNDTASYIFVLTAAAGVLMPMFSLIESCGGAVKGISTLMIGFVPLYAGILAVGGHVATASGMSFLLLGAAGLVGNLSSFVIVPLMSCYLGVGMVGSIMPTGGTNRLGDGIKKAAMWILSLALTLFLGLLSIQTTVNRAADNLGLKAARFMIGSFIPVAGGALSESLTTLIGSVNLLKSSVGMFAVLGIAATVLPVVIELLIWRLVLFLLDIAADLFGVKLKTDILRAADSVLAVLVGVLLFVAVLFIISLAVISGGG
jgi:stage III sporulation protein AE